MEAQHFCGRILSDDHVAAALLHGRVSRVVWVAFWCLTSLLLVSGVVRAIGLSTSPNPTLFLIAASIALFPIGRKFGLQQRARRLYAETHSSSDVAEFSCSEEGFSARSAGGDNSLAWSGLSQW